MKHNTLVRYRATGKIGFVQGDNTRSSGYVTALDIEDTLDVQVDFSFGVFWFPREYLKRV